VPDGEGETLPKVSRPHLQTPEIVSRQETTTTQPKRQNTRYPVKARALISESPSKEKPKYQYHRSYTVDQAGKGAISLKDVEGFPVYLMRELSGPASRSDKLSQPVIHKNLVSLLDVFSSRQRTFLVYSYEHLAVSLGCAAGAVHFSEADIATICKELLEGLVYLHEVLGVAHGSLDCSNIILTSGGEVKIGKNRCKLCLCDLMELIRPSKYWRQRYGRKTTRNCPA
jgi:serine/threonine protein kinase